MLWHHKYDASREFKATTEALIQAITEVDGCAPTTEEMAAGIEIDSHHATSVYYWRGSAILRASFPNRIEQLQG